jgi:hypothetical protein
MTTPTIPSSETNALIAMMLQQYQFQLGTLIDPDTVALTFIPPRPGAALGVEVASTTEGDSFAVRAYLEFNANVQSNVEDYRLEEVENNADGLPSVRHVCLGTLQTGAYPTMAHYANTVLYSPPAPPPAAPTGVTAVAGYQSVTLSWAASSGALSYVIFQGTAAGQENPIPVQEGITGLSVTITPLTPGTELFFKVGAVSASGLGPASAEVNATPLAVVPLTYKTSGCGNDFDPLNVSWTEYEGTPEFLYSLNQESGTANNSQIVLTLTNVAPSTSIHLKVAMDASFVDSVAIIQSLTGANATTTITATADSEGNVTFSAT